MQESVGRKLKQKILHGYKNRNNQQRSRYIEYAIFIGLQSWNDVEIRYKHDGFVHHSYTDNILFIQLTRTINDIRYDSARAARDGIQDITGNLFLFRS